MADEGKNRNTQLRADRASERLDFEPVPKREPKAGRILKLLIVLVMLSGLGLGAWAYFAGPLARTAEDSRLPVVRADHIPFKQRPDNPGGMAIPDRDKLVYGRLPGAEDVPDAEVERLLPPSEEPANPPQPSAPSAESAPDPNAPMPLTPRSAEQTTSQQAAAQDTNPAVPAPPPTAPGSEAVREPVEPASPRPVKQTLADQMQSTLATEATAPPADSVASAAPPAAPAPPPDRLAPTQPMSATDAYMIQLAAVRSPERAELEWERLSKLHQDLLGKVGHTVIRADLGEKGVFFRLRAGPIAAEPDARALCAKLAERKVGCLIVRSDG